MLAMLAMGAALCGVAEYRIEATAMEKEGDGWNIHCEGTKGTYKLTWKDAAGKTQQKIVDLK